MDWLDDELKRAFAKQEPPANFTARTIARAQPNRVAPPRWAVAAAAALVFGAAGYGYHWRQGVAAKDQVLLAFRIAAGKVNQIQAQVLR